ncbi:MAG: alkaline phosphatase, partial [Pseudolabrys sp.]|nr:alkaline phosphatase [Pseudolabrys sp.]
MRFPSAIFLACIATPAYAQIIYPIDRADVLSGAKFDFKVEYPDLQKSDAIKVTINGEDYTKVLGKKAEFIEREDGQDQSALILRDVSIERPGSYKVKAGDKEVTWNVYATGPRKAKNVILFIGDGMAPAHRIGARLLSKGIDQGKSLGKLAIDDMPHMALVATAGSDSIITDSANSASAYATGHKTAVNAMGVYADRSADPFDDPKVENIASLAKRKLNLAVGIVTNTEIQDATP